VNIFSYIEIFSGILLMWLWGRVLINKDFLSSFLAGSVTAGCILSSIARISPIFTREILFLLIFIGVIKFFIDYRKNNLRIQYDLKIIPIIIIVGYFFRIFHYQNWIVESHDILYFSPSVEMLNANYFGNIRVPYYFPYELASTHLLSAGFIASIGFLNFEPNLLYCLEIRYIVSIIFISNILLNIYYLNKMKLWIFCLGIYALFFIYGEEISYNLTVSSFVYVFLLFQIFLHSIKKDNINEILFFSILLISAKAPIFYIAVGMSFYLWYNNKNIRFSNLTIFSSSIVFLSLLSMIFINMPNEPTSFGLMNPLNKNDLLSFSGIKGWSLPDNIKLLIESNIDLSVNDLNNESSLIAIIKNKFSSIIFLGVLMFYIIIKYYFPFYFLYFKNKQHKYLFIYMFISFFGWIFVRNGGLIDHQSHAYFLASLVSFLYILYYFKEKHILRFVIPIGILYMLGKNPTYISSKAVFEDRKNPSGKFLKYNDFKAENSEYYKIDENEPFWKSENQAMVLGQRILADDILLLSQRATKNFVLKGSDNLFMITKKDLEKLIIDGVPKNIIDRLDNIKESVIIGDSRFDKVINKFFINNEIRPYQALIKSYALK
tara:strand:- start:18858 stop:20666 length:1809 start_codon:yes stop_codon:yes gene_type:complete